MTLFSQSALFTFYWIAQISESIILVYIVSCPCHGISSLHLGRLSEVFCPAEKVGILLDVRRLLLVLPPDQWFSEVGILLPTLPWHFVRRNTKYDLCMFPVKKIYVTSCTKNSPLLPSMEVSPL